MDENQNIAHLSFATTFDSLFNSRDDGETVKQVQLKKIIIPMIQRDYVYGRAGKDIGKKRERFLDALYKALQEKTPFVLDFVYGDIDAEGVTTLLDGQQRLTTLFLLYWYAAQKCNINATSYQFLYNFSYDTRPNSRDFCKHLIDTKIQSSGVSVKLNVREAIENESWFLLEYKKDATIKSMLTVLDAIDEKFCTVPSLWQRLMEDKIISFYFLPIQSMGLTDEIYIKMNSRGKLLTDFENFKAELIKNIAVIYEKDTQKAQDFSTKIDTVWTDLLWHYCDDECHIIDDYFLRYFKFVCALICYENDGEWGAISHDEDYLLDKYFKLDDKSANLDDKSVNLDNKSVRLDIVRSNLERFEKYFDIWLTFKHPAELFNKIFSQARTEGKVLITKTSNELDLFEQCIKHFDEKSFTLGKFVMLYAVIQYLINKDAKDAITDDECFLRLRMVRNLVQNSDDELRERRMCAIIKQVKSIVTTGKIESALNGFNEYQVQEEQDKLLQDKPSIAQKLYKLEEHPLLYGQIAIIGLENIDLCDKFYSLFECDKTAINRALLTIRYDYWQDCGWKSLGEQYQAGASNDLSWTSLFHKSNSRSNFDATKDALIKLLKALPDGETFSNDFLGNLIQAYIKRCKEKGLYDWMYYYLSYDEFCPQSYGLYRFNNCGNNEWYEITALQTPRNLSSTSYAPFLSVIKNKIGEGKFVDEFNQELNIRSMVIKCINCGFVIKKGSKEELFNIEQNNNHIDKEERIEKIVDYIRSV